MENKKITVLGGGAWGTAISTVLSYNGYKVDLWSFDFADEIRNYGENKKYLPGIKLDLSKIMPTNMLEIIEENKYIFVAIPVQFIRSILKKVKKLVNKDQIWVMLSKGIENDSLKLPIQIIEDVIKKSIRTAVLSGPSFAYLLANKELTAVDIASEDIVLASELKNILNNNYFKLYVSNDVIGVQLCAAVKNVVAIGVGIIEGLGFGDNTKAFLFTKMLIDIEKLLKKFGGNRETLFGLSGIGDLTLTAMGKLSRNRKLGVMIGKKKFSLDEYTFEGVNTVRSIYQLCLKEKISLPIIETIYQIIFKSKDPRFLLEAIQLEVE